MINIKSTDEIALMAKAGEIVYNTHQVLKKNLVPGITTMELDRLAEDYIKDMGASPAFKGYQGFPGSICTSINDEIVHGIPGAYSLKEGDIISIDIGATYRGYYGDSAWTYEVGKVSEEKKELLKHTEEALYEGMKAVRPGNYIGDISKAVEAVAKKHQLGIVKELVGHGVGKKLHEDQEIPNYTNSHRGPKLKPGMTLAIEPMLNMGTANIKLGKDGWTIKTEDNKPSAHFEHTVVVTEDGYQILTKGGKNG